MANSNFVVHNGLQVGPLTIFAGNGDISTSGNVNISGTVGVSSINKNDSSIAINDTGTGSTVVVTIDGTVEQTIDVDGIKLPAGDAYYINSVSVLNATTLGSGVVNSSLTGLGSLTGLTVTGATTAANITAGGVTSNGTVQAATVNAATIGNTGATLTGTLSTASQPNVTTLGGVTSIGASFGSITAQGNLTVVGNLTVQGNTLTVGSNNLVVQDSIIELHTFANLAPLVSDDGRDIGVHFHYYKGADSLAFLGWENTNQTLVYFQSASETNSNVTGTYGNVQFGSLLLANTTAATSTTTGVLQVRGGVGISSGNLYVGGSGGHAIVATGNIIPSANVTSTNNIGSDTAWWNNFYGVATQARYADLAENYQADLNYEPGTVLAFGGSKEVTIAGEETTRVAGVVSTNPAHLMNGALKGSDVVPLALQGRVPCKVVGPIRKGDMMVAAGHGYAKSSSAPKLGSVIGKALENFDKDKGTIEIVVGRL